MIIKKMSKTNQESKELRKIMGKRTNKRENCLKNKEPKTPSTLMHTFNYSQQMSATASKRVKNDSFEKIIKPNVTHKVKFLNWSLLKTDDLL